MKNVVLSKKIRTMRKVFLLFFCAIFCVAGCKKKDDDANYMISEEEKAEIQNFIDLHADEYQFTLIEPGIYFYSVTEGTGATPLRNNTVKTRYTVWHLDGSVLDTNETIKSNGYYEHPLLKFNIDDGSVIEGFNAAVKNMKEGGHCMVLIPSDKGYKDREPLLFSIKLQIVTE